MTNEDIQFLIHNNLSDEEIKECFGSDNDILHKRIVARNRNNLITIDNEYIPISIIRDIYK